MLHENVETGKTDVKCNNLLKHSCYSCYQDFLFFLHQTRHAYYFHRCYKFITIGTGMLGTIFAIENITVKKNFSFHCKDQGKQTLYKFFISQC